MNGKILVVKHVSNEGPGFIQTHFENQRWPVELINLGHGDALPGSLDAIAAVIMLGGPMNVYEEEKYSFLKKEDEFITRLIIEEIPFLGICLGAQLLSKACQGKVMRMPSAEIGWNTVNITRDGRQDPFFYGLPSRLTVFQWHGDTFEIPEGGRLLVQGKTCNNQAFKVGNYAYGLQFHIEATPGMIREWMKGQDDKVDVKKIAKGSIEKSGLMERQATMLFSNFQRVVESSLRYRRIIKQYADDRTWAEKKAICWWEMS